MKTREKNTNGHSGQRNLGQRPVLSPRAARYRVVECDVYMEQHVPAWVTVEDRAARGPARVPPLLCCVVALTECFPLRNGRKSQGKPEVTFTEFSSQHNLWWKTGIDLLHKR